MLRGLCCGKECRRKGRCSSRKGADSSPLLPSLPQGVGSVADLHTNNTRTIIARACREKDACACTVYLRVVSGCMFRHPSCPRRQRARGGFRIVHTCTLIRHGTATSKDAARRLFDQAMLGGGGRFRRCASTASPTAPALPRKFRSCMFPRAYHPALRSAVDASGRYSSAMDPNAGRLPRDRFGVYCGINSRRSHVGSRSGRAALRSFEAGAVKWWDEGGQRNASYGIARVSSVSPPLFRAAYSDH